MRVQTAFTFMEDRTWWRYDSTTTVLFFCKGAWCASEGRGQPHSSQYRGAKSDRWKLELQNRTDSLDWYSTWAEILHDQAETHHWSRDIIVSIPFFHHRWPGIDTEQSSGMCTSDPDEDVENDAKKGASAHDCSVSNPECEPFRMPVRHTIIYLSRVMWICLTSRSSTTQHSTKLKWYSSVQYSFSSLPGHCCSKCIHPPQRTHGWHSLQKHDP